MHNHVYIFSSLPCYLIYISQKSPGGRLCVWIAFGLFDVLAARGSPLLANVKDVDGLHKHVRIESEMKWQDELKNVTKGLS